MQLTRRSSAADHLRRCVDLSLAELRHPSPAEEVTMPHEHRITGEGTRYGRPSRRRRAAFE